MFVERVARSKAAVVDDVDAVIIAADTTVVFESRVLGKPAHPNEAIAMLSALEGERHTVMTGLAVRQGERIESTVEISEVLFSSLTPDEIAGYVASGEPLDKAGAYAVQGRGRRLVARVSGSLTNVVGLPLERLGQLFVTAGIEKSIPATGRGLPGFTPR